MSSLTTKKAIAYTLKEVLLDKPLSKVTISDITKRCDINRQTFYYHFQDIYALVEWICVEDANKALAEKRESPYPLQGSSLKMWNAVKNLLPMQSLSA